MERLQSHRDFVAVLKQRRKVSSKDIVAHYVLCEYSSEHSTRNENQRGYDDRETTGFDFANQPAAFSATLSQTDGVNRRLGLAVSKSVGNAVTRNRVKRRFRIISKTHEQVLPARCDIVLRAKPSAAAASFACLEQQVEKIFTKIASQALSDRQLNRDNSQCQ